MLKILKYFKPYFILIISILFISIIEVKSELMLPECTRDMITNGIERHGINQYILLIMDKQTRQDILSLMPTDHRSLILKSYKKIIDKSQLKNYHQLKSLNLENANNLNLYIMANKNKNDLKILNNIFFDFFSLKLSENISNIKNIVLKNVDLEYDKSIIKQITLLDDNGKANILNLINKNISKVKSNKITDLIVEDISSYYSSLGVNIQKFQNDYIKNKSLTMLGYILVACITWVLIMLIISICSAGIARDLKQDLVKSVIYFSKREMDKFSVASLINRTTNDVLQIQSFVYFFLENVFFAPLYGIVAFNKSKEINPNMSWIILMILFFMLSVALLILWNVVPKYNIIQKLMDKMNLIIRENLTGLLSIKAFNTQKFEEGKFDDVNKYFSKINLFIEKIMALIDPLIILVTNISTIIIIWVSYKYISNYTMQIGDIIVYINYTMSVIMSFLMLSIPIIEFPRAYVSAKRICAVLNTKPSVTDENVINYDNYDFKGEISFKNVTFRYPDANQDVLKNISFTAKPGETTAIIGPTGSGKSTIINLINRFYDVSEGEILLDGINIKFLSQYKLRQQISYAPQKGFLFKGTIESNMKYGNQSADNEDMEEVAKVAQAKFFIDKKPDKFLSVISQKGNNISGGQRQRLSIARAIMKKSKIYIFDDSFSALDFNTDLALRKALGDYIKSATKIIVAQRIGTILNAHQIIVLDDGKIVGIGTHKQLMKSCKEYYEIALNQLPLDLL